MTNVEDIKKWLKEMSIYDYKINDNLEVDVFRGVDLQYKNLKHIPIQFGIIKGSFNCSSNELTSLKGCPRITLSFNCSNNQLKSLKYGPTEVNGYFCCSKNHLSSLEYSPEFVGTSYDCSNNEINSLPFGMQDDINGYFDCSYNHLSSLENLPSKISGALHITNNKINSFEHVKIVGEDLVADHNPILSIDCIPNYIGGDISFSSANQIEGLEELYIENNNIHYINFSFDSWKKIVLKNKLQTSIKDNNKSHKIFKI